MKNKIFHTQDPCLHTNSRCTKNSSRMEIIMELLEIAKKRHSVRKYTGKEIEQEKLDKILEAAHAAPTAANMQPVRLIVVKSKEGLEKVGKAANIYQAPAAIVVCANKTKAWKRPFDGKITTDIDASILTDHMMLEATELGLGITVAERFSHQMKQNDRLVFAADQGDRRLHRTVKFLIHRSISPYLLFRKYISKKCILAYILHFHIIIDMNVQKHKIESEINRIIPAKPHEIQLCAKISSSMED